MSRLPPITQRDVAEACGVHQSTVCLALKNSPVLPAGTRRKVRATAERLGYRPNAAACHLSLLRAKQRKGGVVSLAWINQEPKQAHWRTDPEARNHFESARRRAGERGYRLEEIWAGEAGMTARRLIRILRARGIQGVIFPVHRHLDLALLTPDWAEFALIGLNDHRLAGWFDVVCIDHFRNLSTACGQLRQLGLTRFGLVLSPELDAASAGLLHGGFLRTQVEMEADSRLPVCILPEANERRFAAFRDWLHRHQPDAVITAEASLVATVRQEGIGVTWIGLASGAAPFDGGFAAASSEIGAWAVDGLVSKMRSFETGLSGASRLHLVPGVWTKPGMAAAEPASIVA